MPTTIDVFAKAREHERLEQLKLAREYDALPYFRVLEGPTLPVVEMEGQERVMLGSNNYLGLTGDERVKQGALDALNRYGTGLTGSRFLNGTIDLHLQLESELAEWMGTEAAIVFTTGHQANLGALGTILGPGRHGDRRLRRPRLDPRRLHPLPRQAARVPPQPARPARAHARAGGGRRRRRSWSWSTACSRWRATSHPLPEIADLCQRFGARLMVDEAHALGVLGARGAGASELLGVEDRVDLRMATFSKSLASCGGVIAGPADVIEYLRIQARPFIFTASAVPAAVGAALAAVRICRSDEGRELFARVLANARYLYDGLRDARLPRDRRRPAARTAREIVTPVVPVLVGDDWKAVFLWKALYDAGVFVNVAIHPAVPPGGALLRTSVMATHDAATLDRALDAFAAAKRAVRGRARPAAGAPHPAAEHALTTPLGNPVSCPIPHKTARAEKTR